MFTSKDPVIYDEAWDVEAPLGTETKGMAAVVEDVFGFLIKDAESAAEEICLVYRERQVEATKKTGTGEAIKAGQRLYAYRASGSAALTTFQDFVVSSSKTGTYGVDYLFCGWAKKDAGALETTVLMNYDGTRWDENL